MLKLKQVPGGLEISLDSDFDVDDFEAIMERGDGGYHGHWCDLLDYPGSAYLGNNWHYLGGNYGLTDGPVIAYGARYDSDDSEEPDGYDHVYWFPEYATRDEFEELREGKTVFFPEAKQDAAPDGDHDDRPYHVCIKSAENTRMYIVNGPNGVLNLVSEVLGDTSGLKCTDEDGYGVLDTDFDISQITVLVYGEYMECGTWANQHGDRVIVQPMSDAAIEAARRLFAIPEIASPVAQENEDEKFLHIMPLSSGLHIYTSYEHAEYFWDANEFDEDDIESHTTILANLLEWGGYMQSGEYTIVWPHQVDIPNCGIMIGRNVVLGDATSYAHDKVVSHCGLWTIEVSDMLSELYHNYQHTTQSRIK